ncbi:polar localization protein TipN [Phenylobacterium deserti]|nr:polar localization protein TipN [Phenylobacterium deserti]
MKIRKRRQPLDFGASSDTGADTQTAFEPAPLIDQPMMARMATSSELDAPIASPSFATPVAAPKTPQPALRDAQPPAPLAEDVYEAPSGWPIYLTALAVSVLWALAPLAYAVGYRNRVEPFTDDAFAMAVFVLLAVGPAAFVFGAAYMIRQGQKLAAESRRAKAMAETMLAPALSAAAEAGDVVQGVREEILRAGAAADEARETLLALSRALASEAERLSETTQNSVRTANELAGTLGRERTEMQGLAHTLDAQATRVADSITQQARMVAEASELAETQLREAEAALSARAADLAAAASEAGDAARTAGEDLVRHIARLETAGVGVSEQIRAVESGLSEQRAALITLSHALRADHESFSDEADAHATRLADFISQARLSAMEMSDRASKGGETLKALMADAAEQFRELAQTAHAEREEFGQSTHQSLEAVSQAAARERAELEAQTRAAIAALHHAAEETREAASRHAAMAREQVDQLSEAAFAAGQKANQVFEARLEEARALVQQSSQMVEQAGAATARKLDEGASAARATLQELETMFARLEERTRQMPASARAQAEQVRAALAHGMDELMQHAHRTAAEAQAIDAAFQERVRRNFDMLSEAVRLMGTVAAAPAGAAPLSAPLQPAPVAPTTRVAAPPPPPTPPPPAVDPAPVVEPQAVAPTAASASMAAPLRAPLSGAAGRTTFRAAYQAPTLRPAPPPPPAAEPEPPEPEPVASITSASGAIEPDEPELELEDLVVPSPTSSTADRSQADPAEQIGLRPRLKLTPTASDQEFSSIFEAAGGPPQATRAAAETEDEEEGGETWTWKDLLASIDGPDAGGGDEPIEAALGAELARMGVEPDRLLPTGRIDEIAAAVQSGDLDGARQVVKRLAPAATRRIVRRLFTDADLRNQAETFVRRYQAVVDDAVVRDPEGFLMASLLGSDAGRLYLLLDAAVGDAA